MVHNNLIKRHAKEPGEYAVLYRGYNEEDDVPRR